MNPSNKIQFYFDPMSRSQVVLRMLEEVNADYEIVPISLSKHEQKSADFLKINPMGKIPVIIHDGIVVTEVAAICLYLADLFPNAKMAPSVDDPQRGLYYRWMFFVTNCFEPAVIDQNFPRQSLIPEISLGYGNYELTLKTLEDTVKEGFITGDQFTTVDLYLSSYLEWFYFQKLIPENKTFKDYINRCMNRPGTQRYLEKRKASFEATAR